MTLILNRNFKKREYSKVFFYHYLDYAEFIYLRPHQRDFFFNFNNVFALELGIILDLQNSYKDRTVAKMIQSSHTYPSSSFPQQHHFT